MTRFYVNEPNVVFEAFDDEIILVNLETGNYYSVRGSGPKVWMAFASGASIDTVALSISAATGGDAAEIGNDLMTFADQLVAAELLVHRNDGEDERLEWTNGFTPPVLETYSDMQDLLMLDPIHDVDETGWPLAKQA